MLGTPQKCGLVLTNPPTRENDVVIEGPSYLNRRLDFPEIDATEHAAAWLKETPEVAIGVCSIGLGGVFGGLGSLLCLLDY